MEKTSNWLIEFRCKSCNAEVTENQRAYCRCCPHCGEMADKTFLKTTQHVYRNVFTSQQSNRRWWQFWIPKVVKTKTRVYRECDP